MAINLQDLAAGKELLAPGHRACGGCTGTNIIRQVMLQAGESTVNTFATGCMEVVTTVFPYTSWKNPFIHVAFENAAAVCSGVETAYRALVKRGDIPEDRKINMIAWGGDGGTYDIGLQSLSGALERGHNILYVCYDNNAYMNTGIQRSGATPFAAATSTSPAGKVGKGKVQNRKDLGSIVVAHNIPYMAQTTPYHWRDLATKVRKALDADGPAFLNVLMPCPVGWRFSGELGMEMARMAVECNFWPLYEVEQGRYTLNYEPKKPVSLKEWLKPQGRYSHIFKKGNEQLLPELENWVNEEWRKLRRKCGLETD